jgi:hypothetical protein
MPLITTVARSGIYAIASIGDEYSSVLPFGY